MAADAGIAKGLSQGLASLVSILEVASHEVAQPAGKPRKF